ncbi:MAG: glycosyltransferase [Nanoarchaeota archaeon]|nr:glycosyltransferase [Nanoarchaeota archaeon]
MKIAIFTDSFLKSKDGVATVTKVLAEELTKRGHKITIVCPNDNTQVLKQKGYKVLCIKSHSITLYREHMVCLKNPEYLEKLEDFSKYDLIHLQTNITLPALGFLLALKYKKPLSCTFHTNIADFATSFFSKEILTQGKNIIHKTLGRFGLVIKGSQVLVSNIVWGLTKNFHNAIPTTTVPSRHCKQLLRSKGVKNPLLVINNPVNSQKSSKDFSQKYDFKNKFVILHVGRLSVEKRVNVLLETVAKLKNSNPNVLAVICSDGPLRKHLHNTAKRLKVSKNVLFTGFVSRDELNWLYTNCNTVTAFGLYETFNLCATEALFYGKPLLVSDSGPHCELIHNNGFLIPVSENESKIFAEKFKMLTSDSKLYNKFCRNSRKLWKSYDFKTSIDKHEAYFINSASMNLIDNKGYINFIKYISSLSIAINLLLFSLSLSFKRFDKLGKKIEEFLKNLTSDSSKLKKSF